MKPEFSIFDRSSFRGKVSSAFILNRIDMGDGVWKNGETIFTEDSTVISFRSLLILLFVPAAVCGWLLVDVYDNMRLQAVAELNERQRIHARQAAGSIEMFAKSHLSLLKHLAADTDIARVTPIGRIQMKQMFDDEMGGVLRSVTRVSQEGKILHTVPSSPQYVGVDISKQKHIAEALKTRRTLISEVFQAVEGYRAIAFHVPVFEEGVYRGTLAAVFSVDEIARRHLHDIRIGRDGYAWMTSREGITIYHPSPGHIGKSIYETSSQYPQLIAMVEQMMLGNEGMAIYTRGVERGNRVEDIVKHAVYVPVHLGDTHWSVVVATPEMDVIESVQWFGRRLYLVVLLFSSSVLILLLLLFRSQARARDEKQRREIEELRRAGEARFRLLAESVPIGIAMCATDGIISYLNPMFQTIFGYDLRDVPDSEHWFQKAYPDPACRAKAVEWWIRTLGQLREKAGAFTEVFPVTCKDGTEKNIRSIVVRSGEEQVLVTYEDITQQLQAEKQIRESEQKLREILEHSTNLFYSHDINHVLTYVSPQSRDFLGYEPEEAMRDWRNFLTDNPVNSEGLTRTERAIETGTAQPMHLLELAGKSGRRRWVEVREAPVVENGKTVAVVGSLTDVTERMLYERELQRIDKVESLGVLAGGIAHDFNNLLFGILGNISLAKSFAEDNAKVAQRLKAAEQACERARDLASQLLVFSRGGKPVKKIIALAQVIEEAVSFVFRGAKVKCIVASASDLWPVDADPGQINQVINNLLINAQQAMPDGGTVDLDASNVVLAADDIPALKAGNYIRVRVRDAGAGIPPENLGKIFDPFFTTKKTGTGLGLASALSIVRNHGGAVMVDSVAGQGTVITFYLPAMPGSVAEPAAAAESIRPGSGRVLVLDDDPGVGEIICEMLSNLGYETVLTADGFETIAAYREALESGTPFDLVIMDLTIPGGVGGKDAMRQLMELHAEVKAVVSSGYSNDPIMANYRAYGFKGVVAKPYRFEDLSAVIREILTS